MIVRRERPEDAPAIHAIHSVAFGPSADGAEVVEARLADELRADGAIAQLSLVAERDGEVVGAVVCSRGTLDGRPSVGLGPIGVRPDLQRDGVGSALMHAVLGAADALGEPAVLLLGAVAYYRRFGFVAASSLGIHAPDPAWGEHFQIRVLSAWDGATGAFAYAAPFDRV